MKIHRTAVAALAAVGIAGLAACHGARTPSDVQLTQLLHNERATPNDPRAPLDAAAVNCLRAWSGDVELNAALPPSASGEGVKTACKTRLDGWIADAARNPDKIRFEDVSAPPSVRRAMALLAEHQGTAMAPHIPSGNDQPPPSLMSGAAPTPPANTGPVDMSAAVAGVNELDGLCQKAKQTAAAGDTTQPISRYASYCDKRIEQMRTRISMLQQRGDARQAEMMTQNVQRTLEMGRQIAAQSKPVKNN